MTKIPTRNDLKVGFVVKVATKRDQGTNGLTSGTIAETPMSSKFHPHEIKVRLRDGQVGRVKKVDTPTTEEPTRPVTVLDAKTIPKTEGKYNEFMNLCQYDACLENLTSGAAEHRKAVEGLMRTMRERLVAAMCAFGNDSSGEYAHLGIWEYGTVSRLERDKTMGNFADYDDLFADHIRNTLETFQRVSVFILRNIQIRFWCMGGKIMCTIQIQLVDLLLYQHTKGAYVLRLRPSATRRETPQPAKYIHIHKIEVSYLLVNEDG